MAKDLLTKHGKYYELNPYKIIQRLEEINDLLYFEFEQKGMDRPTLIRLVGELDGLINDMYDQGQLPR